MPEKLTEPQKRALRAIADGREMRSFRTFDRTIMALERLHLLRRGPEPQQRYGPLTKRGRDVLRDEEK